MTPDQRGMTVINTETRLGRMLDAGRLTATVTSKKTGKHLTVTIKSLAKNERTKRWDCVPFADGKLIVANEGDGSYGTERIGRVLPSGEFRFDTRSPMLQYAAGAVLRAAFTGELETGQHVIAEQSRCGRCGRDLTDPVSIERGIGPECYGKLTGAKSARSAALAETQAPAAVDAAGATGTTVIADPKYGDFGPIFVEGWVPSGTGVVPVPGHTCPDGCCGLQAVASTYDAERGEVEGVIM